MARDEGLEELLRDHLGGTPGLTEQPMFGGRVWLLDGNLLCGARDDGALFRLGPDNDQWALELDGVVPMLSRGRVMKGWVRVASEALGDDALARRLIGAAFSFVRSLPRK